MINTHHMFNKTILRELPRLSRCNFGVKSGLFRQSCSYSRYASNDQIYIHPHDSNSFKFTLTPKENSVALGYSRRKVGITPETFQVNEKFVDLLHQTIGSRIQDDFSFIIEAGANANSYMPIYDFREIPRYGRIPEMDNIFGYVQVDSNGKIIPGTYEANNLYRLCNGVGLVRLSDFLYEAMSTYNEQ